MNLIILGQFSYIFLPHFWIEQTINLTIVFSLLCLLVLTHGCQLKLVHECVRIKFIIELGTFIMRHSSVWTICLSSLMHIWFVLALLCHYAGEIGYNKILYCFRMFLLFFNRWMKKRIKKLWVKVTHRES